MTAVAQYKQCHPDLVTLDITMPEMGGLEALKEIMEYDPKAKVIMVSAMGQIGMVKQAVTTGAKDFILKPFQESRVLEVLAKVL